MNISFKWLKDYLKSDLTAEEAATILTDIGLEIEGFERVESIKGGLAGVVVGEVLTCTNHPDSDHLHLTTVDVGSGEPLQIVCGASNCRQGLKVMVATIGTTLHPIDSEEEFKIKKSKIRGVESFGMLCAEDELGIGRDHAGIMELDPEAIVGTPAKEYLGLEEDYLLEIGLTPNRVDAASHYGVARDLAAYLRAAGRPVSLSLPSVEDWKVDNTSFATEVVVEDKEGAPRYAGVNITKNMIMVILISGALSGLGGALELQGNQYKLMEGITKTYGFDAVGVAVLGQYNPFGMIMSAMLFAMLRVGAGGMERNAGVPEPLFHILQGVIIVCIIVSNYFVSRYLDSTKEGRA